MKYNYIVMFDGHKDKFCNTFEEAREIYDRYKNNFMEKGIKTDSKIEIYELRKILNAIPNKDNTNWQERRF